MVRISLSTIFYNYVMFQELERLSNELREDMRRRRRDLTEDDLHDLLSNYRRQQRDIINKRQAQKSRLDDKLQQKLAERQRVNAVRIM